MSESGLEQWLGHSGIEAEAADRLRSYWKLLQKWNARINLTSRADWQGLGPLFEEGVWASRMYGTARSHLDVGSGAGFPGLLIACMRPELSMDLVEPRSKRVVFLEVAVRELGLKQVKVHEARLKDYLAGDCDASGWDRVSWKALRLSAENVEALVPRCSPDAQFWLFHAQELPVEDASAWLSRMALIRRATFPARQSWHLSMFHVKH